MYKSVITDLALAVMLLLQSVLTGFAFKASFTVTRYNLDLQTNYIYCHNTLWQVSQDCDDLGLPHVCFYCNERRDPNIYRTDLIKRLWGIIVKLSFYSGKQRNQRRSGKGKRGDRAAKIWKVRVSCFHFR